MKRIKLDRLFDAARNEDAPKVDVADIVMSRLAPAREPVASVFSRSLMWMSMASSVVAATIMIAAVLTWQQNADPINEIINAVAWAAP